MTVAHREAGAHARTLLAAAGAVLVDLDGTLVDSTLPVHRAWTAFARRHDLDPTEVIAFAQGRPARETVRLLAPTGADPVMESYLVDHAELRDTAGVTALPGAQALLATDRLPLAIVTSCSRALATVRLHAAGLPMPRVMVTADDVARGKPDPECVRLGAARLHVPAADCVLLEDAPAGIAAGRAAGARVIALRTTHGAEALGAADAVVADLAALLPAA